MSASESDDFIEIRQRFDESMRPIFLLEVIFDGERIQVWDGYSRHEALEAARFWQDDGVQVVDLVASGMVH